MVKNMIKFTFKNNINIVFDYFVNDKHSPSENKLQSLFLIKEKALLFKKEDLKKLKNIFIFSFEDRKDSLICDGQYYGNYNDELISILDEAVDEIKKHNDDYFINVLMNGIIEKTKLNFIQQEDLYQDENYYVIYFKNFEDFKDFEVLQEITKLNNLALDEIFLNNI